MPKKIANQNPMRVDSAVFIRTVTHYYTGRIIQIDPDVLVLADAAWIGDTGRFHIALRDGSISEVEPFAHPVAISRSAIVDCTHWPHALPRAAK